MVVGSFGGLSWCGTGVSMWGGRASLPAFRGEFSMPRPLHRTNLVYFVGVCAGLLGAMALLVAGIRAQGSSKPPIKPGLWEIKRSSSELDGKKTPDVGETLQSLPPQLRERVAAQMRSRGIDMVDSKTSKMCVSAEILSNDTWLSGRQGCKTSFLSRTSSVWKWRSTCDKPPSTAEGETRFKGDNSYTSVIDIKMVQDNQNHNAHMEMQGKWLGADCGDLKPFVPAQE